MRIVTAFALGLVAFGVLAYTGAAALAFLAVGGEVGSMHVGVGPLLLVSIEQVGGSASETTFGPGLLAVALLGGILNAAGATVLGRRRRP